MEFEIEEISISEFEDLSVQDEESKKIKREGDKFCISTTFNKKFKKHHLKNINKIIILDSVKYLNLKTDVRPCGMVVGFGLTKEGLIPFRQHHRSIKSPEIAFIYHHLEDNSLILDCPYLLTLGEFPFFLCKKFTKIFNRSVIFCVLTSQKNNLKLQKLLSNHKIYATQLDNPKGTTQFPPLSLLTGFPAQILTYSQALKYKAVVYLLKFEECKSYQQNELLVSFLKNSGIYQFVEVLDSSLEEDNSKHL
ncbi:hypothetical protein HZS_3147, partial [Henneguya salminicola]